MFIKRLEIFGFKSFKNKTILEFDNTNITGIVGPNGCGKSNIVDALLWVMGENSAKHLRGESLSDIIFGGTSKEEPSGLAEVKLTLGKGDREFPQEYKNFSEIMISRKAYRNGKNECFINDQTCLLRDIRELFMNTGAGCKGFSIIEQESIEKLITAKPVERRFIIEEVAGITKFKNRKQESDRKLDLTNQNLKRLDDILKMQDLQLSQLASQAKKADKYKKLKQEIESRQKQIYSSAYHDLIQEQSNILSKIKEKEKDQSSVEQELNQDIAEVKKIESHIENLHVQTEAITKDILAKKMDEMSLKDKMKTVEMVKLVQNKVKLVQTKKENLKTKEKDIQKEIVIFKDFSGNFSFENLNKKLLGVKEYIDNEKQNKNSIVSNIDILKKQIQFLENEIESLISEEKSFQEQIKLNINQKSKSLFILKKENRNQILLSEKLQKFEQAEDQLLKKKSLLEKELRDLKSVISVLFHKTEQMNNFLMELEEINPGADSLLKSKSEKFNSLFQNLEIDSEYTTALSSVLGSYTQIIVPKDQTNIEIGIDYLKDEKKGKAYFLSSLPTIKTEESLQKDIKTYPAFICFLSEKIKWNLYNMPLKSFMEKTVVVSNLKAGFELKKQFPSFQFVTRDGDFISRDSIVYAGSVDLKISLFQIRDQIKEGNKELTNRKVQLKAKEIQYENCLDRINDIEKDKQDTKQKLKETYKAINLIQQDLDFIEKDNLRLSEIRKKNQNKQKDFQIKKENLIDHQSAYSQEIKKSEDNLAIKNSFFQILESALENRKEQKNLEQEEQLLLNIINQSQNSDKNLSGLELDKEISNNEKQKQNLEQKQIKVQNQLKEFRMEKDKKEQNIKKLEQEIFQTKLDINSLMAEKDKKELEKTYLKNQFLENYKLHIEHYNKEDNKIPLEQLKDEMKKFEQQLDRIKEVNFMALEEYEKLSKENFFLNEQKEDLINSKTEILKVISHIDKICRVRFHDMLEEINRRFSKVFPIVFQGDNAKAELILHEDPESQETGVDILIHPPGKRPQSVSLLSRGEKALTSICLIYSLFLVKPSPFCIIDEADAPLDDANIFRFLSILKEMSKNSQIITITHNKNTMHACRRLYGITQKQPGISQVVSVDLKKAPTSSPDQRI
ncbi:MAG: AAA family ATPase [Bdellovibrionaceae bacterium]|nr:AAA family ATPase [Pseudobdellovibrionaceae bacterium]